jgi:ferredoxin
VCVNEAPDVFALDEDELKVHVLAERPGEMHRPAVESAVRHCPTRAIRVVEDE